MDVVFHDDLMRLRSRNGPANMAAVRHMGLNLIHQINDKASLKLRRKQSDGTTTTSSPPSPHQTDDVQAIPLNEAPIFED